MVLGVAIAVSVLAGALLIGESVRGSLRDLSSRRLGKTDDVISSAGFFREELAADLEQRGQFVADGIGVTCPLIALEGVVVHEPSKRRAGDVKVYGVDERFWKFNGVAGVVTPENRNALDQQSLAAELGSGPGESLLLRLEKPSDIPVESLHGRKEDPGQTIRLNVAACSVASRSESFHSSHSMEQYTLSLFRSVFCKENWSRTARVNTILVGRFPGLSRPSNRDSFPRYLKASLRLKISG